MEQRKKIVLIADDDQSIRSLLISAYTSKGFDICCAEDGVEVLNILKTKKVDLIVTDIAMPNMDGLESLSRIREIDTEVPIIIASVWNDSDYHKIAQNHNVIAYFQKPFNIKTLVEKSCEILSQEKLPAAVSNQTASFFPRIFSSKPARYAWIIGIIIAVSAGFVYRYAERNTGTTKLLPSSYRLPYNNPSSIAWDGESLWILDWVTQIIYKHKLDANLSIEKFYPQGELFPISIAGGKGMLWTISQDGTFRQLSAKDMAVVYAIRLPEVTPAVLAWDGKYLWSCDGKNKRIHRHVVDNGLKIDLSYPYPGNNPVGLMWVGSELWISDGDSASISCFAFKDNILTFARQYALDAFKSGANRMSGIAYDGKNIWTIAEGKGILYRQIPEFESSKNK